MLSRIKLIERASVVRYCVDHVGDVWIIKNPPGHRYPHGVTGRGNFVVSTRQGAHRFPTFWAALKHADSLNPWPIEKHFGDRRDLINVRAALTEMGESPAEVRAIDEAEEEGRAAFRSISGRLMDALRGTKRWPEVPACRYRNPERVAAWKRGYTQMEQAFQAA